MFISTWDLRKILRYPQLITAFSLTACGSQVSGRAEDKSQPMPRHDFTTQGKPLYCAKRTKYLAAGASFLWVFAVSEQPTCDQWITFPVPSLLRLTDLPFQSCGSLQEGELGVQLWILGSHGRIPSPSVSMLQLPSNHQAPSVTISQGEELGVSISHRCPAFQFNRIPSATRMLVGRFSNNAGQWQDDDIRIVYCWRTCPIQTNPVLGGNSWHPNQISSDDQFKMSWCIACVFFNHFFYNVLPMFVPFCTYTLYPCVSRSTENDIAFNSARR